nr:MAG TPA: hypothetical protein [Caudoviricetes sp.]
MKAIIFYITFILSTLLLCSIELSFTWLVFVALDITLITWCYNNITFREFIKYSGYSTWYKFLRS